MSTTTNGSTTNGSSKEPKVTNFPAIKNAPLVGLAEGNATFNNLHLAGLILFVPWLLKRILPLFNRGGFKTYVFLLVVTGAPTAVGYWTAMSTFGPRVNEKVQLPGKDIEEYITIKDVELKKRYHGKEKIPMQIFHDAYFEGKIDFNGMSHSILHLCLFLRIITTRLTCPLHNRRRS